MRRCYLVCYDVRDPKRLRLVHKLLRGYGEHWQFSVFFCVLKDIDRVRMEEDLKQVINQREDNVLVVDLGSNEDEVRAACVSLGQAIPEPESGLPRNCGGFVVV